MKEVKVMTGWDHETDVLVVGSGAGAMTAAIVAADHHADVLVIEKGELFGGTSATSGGVIWIPNSHLAKAAGQQDSREEAIQYISALAGDVEPGRIEAFVDMAPAMLQYVEREADVLYNSIPYTDYHAELPGGKLGWRSHDPVPLDGRLLGDDLNKLRPTHPAAMLFGKISWTAAEAAPMITRWPGWISSMIKVLWRYYSDVGQRLKSDRSRYLTGGNALVGRLKLAMDRRKVPLWRKTAFDDLIIEGGRVVGVTVIRDGQTQRIRARKGVILGAGGFERNSELRGENLRRSPDPDVSGGQPDNKGDALVAAQRAGAATQRLDSAWWAPTVKVPGEDRARPLFFERSLPGSIIVNQAGKRFTNEAASYHIVGKEMFEKNVPGAETTPAYIIFDATFRHKYPMGPVMPLFPDFTMRGEVKQILTKANSIAELGAKLGLPVEALLETVERFNANALRGEDPDFGRGHQPYDRYYGDPKVQPNPNLLPLEKGPFYALPVNPGDIGTNGGLVTDSNGAVLDEAGKRIPGLYAIGNTASSVMGRSYPGAGATIGPAMTFGYAAARDVTGANQPAG
ncbi:FAD-dependent oxidoreductase [Sphingomonas sp. KC8]|uniref:FAD-dependent oxidoreductase n=1 Tax=Sphingomonas sp. KC8 TaxID=1030157 RepID=UPI000A31E3FC|nr:FAD-dependent oxidoreductase [Sphingomonas sp. KC8]ARS26230.1 fumarate reductase/succinate dehydrogenase flavoprotein domain-containing protein [Sphingomonas sp. KC8]